MIFAVGSTNPVKLEAVRRGAASFYAELEVRGGEVKSGVRAQPVGDEETMRGAANRARAALAAAPEADFGVGLEGGVAEIGTGMYCFAWCAVVGTRGQACHASTGRCLLPEPVAALIRQGMELGAADDIVFRRTNSRHGEGAVGLLTHGRIDRASFYAPAVTMALVMALNPSLYAVAAAGLSGRCLSER